MSPLENVKTPPSLKDVAFQTIRKAILTGRLEAGEMYNEISLAKEMGISRTPVREALLDLANKGFVVYEPRKGVRISRLTPRQIVDLLKFRSVLERGIVQVIIPFLTDEHVRKIEAIDEKEIEAAKRLDTLAALDLNREFHIYLATLTENQYIISALENIYDLIDWTVSKALLFEELIPSYIQHHKGIVAKLKKRDFEGAQKAIEEHIAFVEKTVLEWLGNNEKM